ncbi:MAG: twitching motility protein PilT [Candidatus Thermoplasmatota archaeon]|nr:twitching motility protein PilT [Candidatus Thermoplasmatota archaeon]
MNRPSRAFDHVILDSNALMSPFQFGYNLDLELARVAPWATPVVPSSVLAELEKLSGKGEWRAKAALALSAKYETVHVRGKGDPSIIGLASNKNWMVMTNDRGMRAILARKGIPVILVRENGHLSLMEA